MPLRAQFAWVLAALFALLVGVSVYQQSSRGPGRTLALPELPLARDYYGDELRKQQHLASFDGMYEARGKARLVIIEQLRDGRIGLLAAAAEFKRLNAERNPTKLNALSAFPGADDNERTCRQVISWLEANSYSLPPSQRQAVMARVEAELRDQRDCAGTVVLPGD